jgi:hypothetical protein
MAHTRRTNSAARIESEENIGAAGERQVVEWERKIPNVEPGTKCPLELENFHTGFCLLPVLVVIRERSMRAR